MALLFSPLGHGGNEEKLCQVCGQEHPGTQEEARGNAEPVRKCPPCRAFEKLGDDLRNARFIVLNEITLPTESVPLELDKAAGTWADVLECLGMRVEVHNEAGKINSVAEQRQVIWAVTGDDLALLPPTATTAVGRRYLVNVTPVLQPVELNDLREDPTLSEADRNELGKVGDVKSFTLLAHQSQGIDRLGVLRMDVDNLGELFQTGFGEQATLSRIAGLSSAISLYFEGWVSRVVEEVNQKRGAEDNCIYTIYSGGDDLFFVGAWDAIVELAVRIRADLTTYAAGHPGIHLSGGIALVGNKYPLAQAAEDADAAEKAAKDFVWWDGTGTKHSKDAISFLDEVLPWSRFGMENECAGNLDTAHGLMHTLVDLTSGDEEEKAAPKAFVRNLIELYGQYTTARNRRRKDQAGVTWDGQEQVLWGPWTWRASYTLHRLHQRTKSSGVVALEESLRTGDYQMMEWLGVAARWADLYTRRSK